MTLSKTTTDWHNLMTNQQLMTSVRRLNIISVSYLWRIITMHHVSPHYWHSIQCTRNSIITVPALDDLNQLCEVLVVKREEIIQHLLPSAGFNNCTAASINYWISVELMSQWRQQVQHTIKRKQLILMNELYISDSLFLLLLSPQFMRKIMSILFHDLIQIRTKKYSSSTIV